jgi:hypothetical protein
MSRPRSPRPASRATGLATLVALLLLVVSGSARGDDAPPTAWAIHATRLSTAPTIDGKLDDEAWRSAPVLGGFTQMEPRDGFPAAERTEVRIGYDVRNLYVAFRCYASDLRSIDAASMNRDASLAFEEHVEISIDSFHDHQNAFMFLTNPRAARVDGTLRDDGEDVNWDWDGVWSVETSRDAQGWSAEFAIPFSVLRYPPTDSPVFGINFARFAAKNLELSFWKPLHYDRGLFGSRYKVSDYGEIAGFWGIGGGNLFELRPYAMVGAQRIGSSNAIGPLTTGGLDVRVPLTTSLVANATINPDFADTDVDEQKLNLTRFPLLYPEKREFFKEDANLFQFGDRVVDNTSETFEQFKFFHSRQIGLLENGTAPIPVLGGARITGQVGPVGVGAMNLSTPEIRDPNTLISTAATNYSVMRLKYQLPDGSSFGVMGLNKQSLDSSYNRGAGADGNLVVSRNLRVGGYVARTESSDVKGDDVAASADALWQSQNLSVRAMYTDIGANFRPDMGYLTRAGIRKVQAVPTLVFSSAALGITHVTFAYNVDYVMDREWRPVTRLQKGETEFIFDNGWGFSILYSDDYESIATPYNVYGNIDIPAGNYSFRSLFFGLASDPTRFLSGVLYVDGGEFWGGHRFRTRIALIARPSDGLVLQTIWDRQPVSLPWGDFTSNIASGSAVYAFTPNISMRTTLQYSSDDSARANALLNWSYMPGANAYVIFNDQRDLAGGRPWLDSMMIAVKIGFVWGVAPSTDPHTTQTAVNHALLQLTD